MTEQELQEFKVRVQYALFNGFGIAKAEEYAEQLTEEGATMSPPQGVEALSAAHLLAMIEQVEKAQGPAPKVEALKKPEAKKAEPKIEIEPKKSEPPPKKVEAKKTEPKIEIKPAAEPKIEVKSAEPAHHDSADFTSVLEELAKDEAKKS